MNAEHSIQYIEDHIDNVNNLDNWLYKSSLYYENSPLKMERVLGKMIRRRRYKVLGYTINEFGKFGLNGLNKMLTSLVVQQTSTIDFRTGLKNIKYCDTWLTENVKSDTVRNSLLKEIDASTAECQQIIADLKELQRKRKLVDDDEQGSATKRYRSLNEYSQGIDKVYTKNNK